MRELPLIRTWSSISRLPYYRRIWKQTRQRNNLIKASYERLIKEDQCPHKTQLKNRIWPPNTESPTATKNKHNGRPRITCLSQDKKCKNTWQRQSRCPAASIILEKTALNDEENLSEIKREILKIMNCSGEPAPQDPPADANFSKNTKKTHPADSLQDPEPAEAQEQETTTHTDA